MASAATETEQIVVVEEVLKTVEGGPSPRPPSFPPSANKDKNVVVVAVDGGPFSEAAFKKALRMLDRNKTIFHLLHIRPHEATLLDDIAEAVKEYHRNLEEKRMAEARALFAKFTNLAEGWQINWMDFEAQPHLFAPQGDPREEICRYCADVTADLLVLGSRGQGAAGRLLMGSVSTYCVSHAPCTVLVHHDTKLEEKTLMQSLIEREETRHK